MGSAWYVVSLAVHRLRRRDGGAVAAALGIAAAAAVLAGILVGGTVAKDRSVAQDVERLPAAPRAVRASWFGVPAGAEEAWPTLDRQARAALAPLPAGDPVSIALVRESTIGGVFVGLAAVDGLAPHVLLHTGRLPRACRPSHCEVLRLRGKGRLPNVPGLRIVQVGTASLRSRQLFGDFLSPADNALEDAELAPRSPGRRAITCRRPGRSSSPRASPVSSRLPLSQARTAATAGCSLCRPARPACGRSMTSSATPTARGRRSRRARRPGPSRCRRRSWALPSRTRRWRAGVSSWSAARRPRSWSRSPCSLRAPCGVTWRPPGGA